MQVMLQAETDEIKMVFSESAAWIQSKTNQVWNIKALFATGLANKFWIIQI